MATIMIMDLDTGIQKRRWLARYNPLHFTTNKKIAFFSRYFIFFSYSSRFIFSSFWFNNYYCKKNSILTNVHLRRGIVQ